MVYLFQLLQLSVRSVLAVVMLFLFSCIVNADERVLSVEEIQQRWAEVNYQRQGEQQLAEFEALLAQTDQALKVNQRNADLLIWRGIVQSTYAGARGGLGALKLAKAAKADLEAAIAIDPTAQNGSAYTSLGTLYANVPSWPIGFGSDKKARQLLLQALQINPDGIDCHFFYAQFLHAQGEHEQAREHYQAALQAAPRAGRESADRGRRAEIEQALASLK